MLKTNTVNDNCSLPLDTITKCNNIDMDNSESESTVEMIEERIAKPKKKKYAQKFKIEWKQKWTWLQKMKGSSYCILCNKTLMSGITHLERHAQSNMHKKKETCQSKVPMTDLKTLYFRNTTIQAAELKLCMFISEHNLPFQILEHLPKLIQSICPDLNIAKEIKCSRIKGTQILKKQVAPYSMMEICNILKTTKFSLIIDETTDISVVKSLAVVIRYFDTTELSEIDF